MIARCPVCDGGSAAGVIRIDEAPIFQLLPGLATPDGDDFAVLDVVRCRACGHLYNRAHDPALAERMYRGDVLSNVPVHMSMTRNLEAIAEWIGFSLIEGRHVVEVGAGSGHLARILARTARSVVVFEPSPGLRPAMLPEHNIILMSESFDPGRLGEPADLMICRQVLEHVAAPREFLARMASCLAGSGRLYLEVPRAEYIEERAALFDLHCAHMQYFHEANLLVLAGQVGLVAERQWHLKEGHDIGVLLRRGAGRPVRGWRGEASDRLAEDLERRRAQAAATLAALPGEVMLYGATWQGVAFLTMFQRIRGFLAAIDDNPAYEGYVLYSRAQSVPVRQPGARSLAGAGSIVITAYLHDEVIAQKVRAYGFTGPVMTLRADGEKGALPTA